MKRVAVVGLGKLGACVAQVLSRSIDVIGYDTDENKLNAIRSGHAPVAEPGLEAEYNDNPIPVISSVDEAVALSDRAVFIVPTPSLPDGSFTNRYLLDALTAFAKSVAQQSKQGYLFIISSTTVPGTCENVFEPLLDSIIGKGAYGLCYKPEFIALGTILRDMRRPDVVLIGASTEVYGAQCHDMYRAVVGNEVPVHVMSLTEAEIAKISLNCAVTMKISFANQVGMLAQALDCDARKILRCVGDDHRVGPHALLPGLPFGGPCFPRDNRMFAYVAHRNDVHAPIAMAVDDVNERTKRRILAKVIELIETGDTVGILGMGYKPGTSFTEESLGAYLRDKLMLGQDRFTVKTYDPEIAHSDSFEAVCACDIVVVATADPRFRGLKFNRTQFVIDEAHIVESLEPAVSVAASSETIL